MLSAKGIRQWYVIHKWTSLVSTLFILIACVTGVPLVFKEEIQNLTASASEAPPAQNSIGDEAPTVDDLAAQARRLRPDAHLQLLYREASDPGVTGFAMGETLAGSIEDAEFLRIETATGVYLDAFRVTDGVMGFLLELHKEIFAGLAGTLFLGLTTIVLMASVISGFVLYATFMRRRSFAVIRTDRDRRTRWFDLHNTLGIVLLVWLLVVSGTGVVNTWASPITQLWLLTDMQRIADSDPPAGREDRGTLASIDAAMRVAAEAVPDGDLSFVALPGSELTSDRHYLVVFTGKTPVTSRLYQGAVVNAATAELIAVPDMPWYMTAALLSQPLHFGDYGGLAFKVVWALLGLGTILLLWSGLVIWWQKRYQNPKFDLVRPEAEI